MAVEIRLLKKNILQKFTQAERLSIIHYLKFMGVEVNPYVESLFITGKGSYSFFISDGIKIADPMLAILYSSPALSEEELRRMVGLAL